MREDMETAELKREKHAARQRVYYHANKDKKRAYYQANKEKIAVRQRAVVEANKEHYVQLQKAWREANKERHAQLKKAWASRNRDKVNADSVTLMRLKREQLDPSYVKQLLRGETGIAARHWPEEFVQAYAANIKLKRQLKQL
jgi:hypothetical protein